MSNLTTSTRGRRTADLAGVVATLLVLVFVAVLAAAEAGRHQESVVSEVQARTGEIRARMEASVAEHLFGVQSLVGFVASDPEAVSEESFLEFIGRHEAQGGVVPRALQLAPDAVVTYIAPLEGNEAAVGHDLRGDPQRAAAVERAIATGDPIVAGPFELLQGGVAIIFRQPIFLDQERLSGFWGFSIAVIDLPPLLQDTGWHELEANGLEGAIRGKDGLGSEGETFVGDPALFDDARVTSDVEFHGGSWELAIQPLGGWAAVAWPGRDAVWAAGFVLAIASGLLVRRSVRSHHRVQDVSSDLATLVATVPSGIIALDPADRVTRVNRAAADLVGRPVSELVGGQLDADDLCADQSPASCAALGEVLRQAREAVTPVSAEVELQTPRGTRLVEVVASPAGDVPSGHVVLVLHDLEDRREMERIRTQNEALARTAQLKDEFLAGMSHELRTPLNGVIGLSQILAQRTFGDLNAKQQTYVEQIEASGRHLLSLINDVLDLTKIEAQGLDMEREAVAAAAVAEDALAMVRPSFSDGPHLRVDVDEDALLWGDRRRVTQVLVNLLANAAKFTPGEGRVDLVGWAEANDIVFEVRDTGVGIARDKMRLLFEPFQQVDGRLDRRHGGTGLGLALTKRLLAQLDGTIEVSSEPGVGSTFRVRLPRASSTGAATGEEGTHDVAAGPTSTVVVLAEDHDLNRSMLTDFLEASGLVVHPVRNGEEAVAAVAEHRPDVVLMDVQMPVLDGLAATRRLKADEALASIPVVALTALAMRGDEQRCLDAGCDAYLTKPFDPDEVLALVTTLPKATA